MTDSICPWCNKPGETSPCPACGKRRDAPQTGRLNVHATNPIAAAQSLRHLALSGLIFVVAFVCGRQSHLQNGAVLGLLFATMFGYPLLWIGLCRLCCNADLPGSSANRNVRWVLMGAIVAAAAKLWLFLNPPIEGQWIALALSSIGGLFFFQRYLRDVAVHYDRADLVAYCDQVLWGFVAATAISGFVIWSQGGEGAILLLMVASCVLGLLGLDLTLRIASTLESNGKAASPAE